MVWRGVFPSLRRQGQADLVQGQSSLFRELQASQSYVVKLKNK